LYTLRRLFRVLGIATSWRSPVLTVTTAKPVIADVDVTVTIALTRAVADIARGFLLWTSSCYREKNRSTSGIFKRLLAVPMTFFAAKHE
jgi:hypothetical protein